MVMETGENLRNPWKSPETPARLVDLAFVADSSCTILPNDVRTRAYAATIPLASNTVPANASFGVTVRGAFKGWDVISMGIAGDCVSVWLETLVEQIAPNTFLSFGGLAAASIGTSAGSTITLPFDGEIDCCVTKSESGRYEDCYQTQAAAHLRCTSTTHRLILTRR